MTPIIRIENLHHTYNADTAQPIHALQAVSLTIQQGEYVVILGHNGCHTFAELFTAMYGQHPYADRFSALGMLVGYLDLLVADRTVVVEEIQGVFHYGVQP